MRPEEKSLDAVAVEICKDFTAAVKSRMGPNASCLCIIVWTEPLIVGARPDLRWQRGGLGDENDMASALHLLTEQFGGVKVWES